MLLATGMSQTWAFLAPNSSVVRKGHPQPLQLTNNDANNAIDANAKSDVPQKRRDFLFQSLGAASLISTSSISSFPSIARAGDDDYLYKRTGDSEDGDMVRGGMTSELFNPDGTLRDPNTVVEAQERDISLPFSIPSSSDGVTIGISTDGVQSTSPSSDATTNLQTSYTLPLKWNQDASSELPLYYDSSEGKNGKSCNRITVYSVSASNKLDMSTLEKASRVGVGKSLFMDQIANNYFDQGVLKADLVGGRTVRKPIKSLVDEGEYDEQIYYEFDMAFAPLVCADFSAGNEENLGLGFCPYDNIFLVSATVLKTRENDKNGTLMVCVVECNKDEWKMANSDLKRVRSSFSLERA